MQDMDMDATTNSPTRYDALRNFAPISLTTRGPEVLVVRPDLQVKTAASIRRVRHA